MWKLRRLCSQSSPSPYSIEGEPTWEDETVLRRNKVIPCAALAPKSLLSHWKASGACVRALNCSTWTFYSCMIGALIKSGERDGARVSPLCPSHFRHLSASPRQKEICNPRPSGEDAEIWQASLCFLCCLFFFIFFLFFLEQKNILVIVLTCPRRGFVLFSRWHLLCKGGKPSWLIIFPHLVIRLRI